MREKPEEGDQTAAGYLLKCLGTALHAIFGSSGEGKATGKSGKDDGKAPVAEGATKGKGDGKSHVAPIIRALPAPGAAAKNRADMLISVEDERTGERSLPVWVAQAESPRHVIDVVLSVYLRRARLPEPGEIVFCTPKTTLEEVNLLFRRFIAAKSNGRNECVFCLADVHALTYTSQCAVVESLRAFLGEFGYENAASLVMVSGKPQQVLLNSLSAHKVELPPLDEDTIRSSLNRACTVHCGETTCVTSSINGGGKTHWVLKAVGARQKQGEPLHYRRVPFRESSSAASLVTRFIDVSTPGDRNAFHLDIAHIIPPSANTVLFELLIVGVIKNTTSCRVYHRSSNDVYYLEIPNSRGEKNS